MSIKPGHKRIQDLVLNHFLEEKMSLKGSGYFFKYCKATSQKTSIKSKKNIEKIAGENLQNCEKLN